MLPANTTPQSSACRETGLLEHDRQLLRAVYSRCGKYVFAAGLEPVIQRWDLETQQRTVLAGHEGWVLDLAAHPDGKRLFSSDSWGSIFCWSYADSVPQTTWVVKDAHQGLVRRLALSPDGTVLASCGDDGCIRLWSAADGQPRGELSGPRVSIFSLEFHPHGPWLVTGDLLGAVRVWDCQKQLEVRQFDASRLTTNSAEAITEVGGVVDLACSRDGTRLSCCGVTDFTMPLFGIGRPLVLEFDWESGELRRTLPPTEDIGIVRAVAYLDDGRLVAVSEGDVMKPFGGVWFWRPEDEQPYSSLRSITFAYDLDVHPRGTELAVTRVITHGATGNDVKPDPATYVGHKGVVSRCELLSGEPSNEPPAAN